VLKKTKTVKTTRREGKKTGIAQKEDVKKKTPLWRRKTEMCKENRTVLTKRMGKEVNADSKEN
jgi:hypothetical protein